MSKRKRSAANDAPAEGGGEEDEEVQAQLDEEEDSEMQRRLAERRSAENDRMMCAAHTFVFAREPLSVRVVSYGWTVRPFVARSELYESFIRIATPEQLERFEQWKRSSFPRAAMRRLMADILGSSTERGAIVLVSRQPHKILLRAGCRARSRAFFPSPRLSSSPLSRIPHTACAQAAVSKMFVGELVESAREQMSAAGETGPIQPTHLRRAHRRAKRAGTVPPNARHTPRLFWRSDTGA